MNNKLYRLSISILPSLIFIALAVFLLKNSFSYSDPDLGWHLRIGQDIALSRQAPVINNYNYTLSGQSWVDHEWLLNWLLALIFNYGGFLSLHLIFVFLALAAFFIAWRRSWRLLGGTLADKFLSCLFLFFGIWASLPHLGIRVQEVGLLGLSVLFLIFSDFSRYRRYFWGLPVMFLIWANVHGSFLLGLVLVGAYFIYSLLSPWLARRSWSQVFLQTVFLKKDQWHLGLIFCLSLAATLINPYGLGLYAFLSGYTHTFYLNYIQEWRNQFVFPLHYAQLIYLAVAAAGLFLFGQKKFDYKIKFSLWDWGLFLFFFFLALKSRRHFPIFVLVSLPILTGAFREDLILLWRCWSYRSRAILTVWTALAAFLFICLQTAFLPWKQDGIKSFCNISYPCAAVVYLQAHPETKNWRLFNEYSWGGFLLWAYPEKQLFIDGRMPQVLYRGHTIFEEYLNFRRFGDKPAQKLEENKINLVLISSQNHNLHLRAWEKIFFQITDDELAAPDYLRQYLDGSPDWQLAFKDKFSLIYTRKQ